MANVLGVMGGSGIYDLPQLEDVQRLDVDTPFGRPSGPIVSARHGETRLLFLPRHGAGHRLSPSNIDYRANVAAMKLCGATHLVSLSAVGSMREDIAPGEVVIVDQYLDFTKQRASTFFDDGIVAHVGFGDPVCPLLARELVAAAKRAGATVHDGGTYVCIEGPQFSTRAESRFYRSLGVSVIGMTAMPEAKLAREAELPYATVALVTDYDCWHETAESVSVHNVLAVLRSNADQAQRIVLELSQSLPDATHSPAHRALASALITAPEALGAEVRSRLGFLISPHLSEHS
ncbi:MAG: S-methyl-5'-thioadenosine phosphorylase [Polyangiaceae bacterium]|nr:S-methyl-5'-thioadenosine phosphorylase [Polyangiaceae bacterium]